MSITLSFTCLAFSSSKALGHWVALLARSVLPLQASIVRDTASWHSPRPW